ncbi:endonuclease/exonuclease/phosphatase family protein [Streptomyces sp. MAA16]|uniref:endonuclease/exonuclease/phosphatase family protein n=1 Tax=Streptomyces sp. MAA16 TaxID=3035116 RepID=UPI00247F15CA|nr:endonuclease/exonuclease/phosphatase family metal-dependent hydrolase [Streptomyces sp. MAA16]
MTDVTHEGDAGPQARAPGMRCGTFNVLHGRALRGDGRPVPFAPGDPRAPLATAVAAVDADLLALQEVDRYQDRSGLVDQAAVAAAAMDAVDWRYASAVHGRTVPGRGWVPDPEVPGARLYGPGDVAGAAGAAPSLGIALLSRRPVRAWRVLRLAPAPVPLPLRVAGRAGLVLSRDQARAAVAAVVEGERGAFTAVALHLSFVPGWNARQLRAVRRWIVDLPRPWLLLGDFNLVGPLPRAVLNGPLGGEWADLARTPTYPAHRPAVQFDHLLAAGVGEAAAGAVCAPRTGISDHRPLLAELPL